MPLSLSSAFRFAGMACTAMALALLAGCQRAPAYSILGSFFPVWLFCCAAGIVLASLLYLVLLRLQLHEQLSPPLLIYPALAIVFSLALWLVFFS